MVSGFLENGIVFLELFGICWNILFIMVKCVNIVMECLFLLYYLLWFYLKLLLDKYLKIFL